jgi:hypothetical protein
MTPQRSELVALPRREELEALARHYHHLRAEHERAPVESSTRRRLEERLLEVRERFERVLEEWVPDEELRQEWRDYLHYRRPEPEGPEPIRRVVFRGRSDVGTNVEITGAGDELRVEVDGSLVERIDGDEDFTDPRPLVRFRLNGVEFQETFQASPAAVRALADFVESEGSSPPWEHAAELLADGLIDVHFDLTPRGRRALAGSTGSASG